MLYIKNLERVRIFLTVVEKGSIASASKALRKSQTSISNSVCNLEIDLGVDLLSRCGHKAIPTEKAKKLIPYLENLLSYEGTVSSVVKNFNDENPSLNIYLDQAIPPEICSAFKNAIDSFQIDTVKIYRGICPERLSNIKKNENNIAITVHEEINVDFLSKWILGDAHAYYAISSTHPLASKPGPVNLSSLRTLRQLSLNEIGIPVIKEFKAISTDVCYTDSFSDMISLIKEGIGWGVVPGYFLRNEVEKNSIKLLDNEYAPKGSQFKVFCYFSPSLETTPFFIQIVNEIRRILNTLDSDLKKYENVKDNCSYDFA